MKRKSARSQTQCVARVPKFVGVEPTLIFWGGEGPCTNTHTNPSAYGQRDDAND